MSRLTLDSVEWGEFRIKDLFELHLSKGDNQANLLDEGNIPLVSSGLNINGISKFIREGDGKSDLFDGKILTVDMFGKAFYHEYNFFSVSHGRINILIPKFEITKFIAVFIVAEIDKNFSNVFSYNRMCSQKRLRSSKILLPIDSKGNPDWQFMEDYVKQEMQAQSQRIVSYYENKLLKLRGGVLDLEIDWKEFEIKDVFETFAGTNGLQVPTGSYIKKSNLEPSEIPRITVKETNNGIDNYGFSKDKNFRVFENFISVSFLGGAFYHPYKASIDMKVHALTPKRVKLDEYNANFLINSIKNNIKHSSYGNQLSSTDLPRVKIMLPTDKNGEPHWEYMSNFIKKLEKENIEKTLEHIYNIYDSKEA